MEDKKEAIFNAVGVTQEDVDKMTDEEREKTARGIGCLFGFHNWHGNRCIDCGKTR